jgi:putative oxidoreductase
MMERLQALDPRWGITPMRITMGVILLVAGYTKWMAIPQIQGFFTSVGIPAPGIMALYIATLELVGGALLILGLGARFLGVLYIAEFLVAAFVVKLPRQGWDASRIDLLLLAGGVMLLLAGAGKLSLDEWLARRRTVPAAEPVRRTARRHA